MRRRRNKISSRAPNLRPPRTEPQDAAPAAPPPELPNRVRARPDKNSAVRATVGRGSSGGMDAAGAFVFARDASLQDAGGFASPAGRRPAIDKPYPRRNLQRRARTKRADFGAPEQHGSSRRDAATPQQDLKPRPQPETTQNRAAGCGAGRATPGTPQPCSRTPSTRTAPSAPPSADEAPAAWMLPERSCLHETRACRTQADLQVPREGRPAMTKPVPPPNIHRRARTKRADFGAPEQHGSSRRDAATPQQDLKPRPQPQTIQNRAAGGGVGRATPGTPQVPYPSLPTNKHASTSASCNRSCSGSALRRSRRASTLFTASFSGSTLSRPQSPSSCSA